MKSSIFIVIGVLSIYSGFSHSEEGLQDDKTTEACIEILKELEGSTTFKVLGGKHIYSDLTFDEAVDWVKSTYSGDIVKDIIPMLEENYKQGNLMNKRSILVYYEVAGKAYRTLTTGFLCSFEENPFSGFHLKSVTYNHKDYNKDSYLLKTMNRPKLFDLLWVVKE
ncbi:hypothetical protein [Alteromonas gilva]|uniref:Uncharacterized protein n=1 Tax=Alteromonas gilva TaxID=2987522 RepID=A0ABT5L794_9ALTE|nr:hypothetical protein [Alteromonas gilva]MDC8832940.1 hypothetical protein [Alteromonas gilva]